MAIPQEEYIKITSGVAARPAATNRELIGRVLTSNKNAPYDVSDKTLIEFTSPESVATFFGSTSDEYDFASKYFGFISKDIRKPAKISFMRYDMSQTAFGATIASENGYVGQLTRIVQNTAATIKIKVNGNEEVSISGIDFSEAGSFSDVASTLQTAIKTKFNDWTVEYQATPQKFFIKTSVEGKLEATITDDTQTVAADLGLLNPIISNGRAAGTYTWTDEFDRIFDLSNNCGSFTLMDFSNISTDEIITMATWNANKNVKYMFVCPVSDSTRSAISTAIGKSGDGTWLQYDVNNTNAQFACMAIGATFNYATVNTNANFDFYPVAGLNVQVSTKEKYDALNAQRVNFYGMTQQAGAGINFLQHGFLCGSISDAAVFYNEMWLKDDIWTRLMNLFIAVKRIPANQEGALQCKGIITNSITQAINNGTILKGKTLSDTQKANITEITGDEDAWRSVENNGYYLTTVVSTVIENGVEKFVCEYTLLYAKGDSIRKIEGRDILY